MLGLPFPVGEKFKKPAFWEAAGGKNKESKRLKNLNLPAGKAFFKNADIGKRNNHHQFLANLGKNLRRRDRYSTKERSYLPGFSRSKKVFEKFSLTNQFALDVFEIRSRGSPTTPLN